MYVSKRGMDVYVCVQKKVKSEVIIITKYKTHHPRDFSRVVLTRQRS